MEGVARDRPVPWAASAAPPSRTGRVDMRFAVRTLDDASWCADVLGRAVGLPAAIALGLRELLLNAVEHGNLELSFGEKSALLADGTWDREIARRLASPRYRDRRAHVEARLRGGRLDIRIRDAGAGFDWPRFVDDRGDAGGGRHGRGIAIARAAGFASFAYRGGGNEVRLGVALPDEKLSVESAPARVGAGGFRSS